MTSVAAGAALSVGADVSKPTVGSHPILFEGWGEPQRAVLGCGLEFFMGAGTAFSVGAGAGTSIEQATSVCTAGRHSPDSKREVGESTGSHKTPSSLRPGVMSLR